MPYKAKTYDPPTIGKEYRPNVSEYNKQYNEKRKVNMPHHQLYNTKEWRRLRSDLIKDRCELCGSEHNLKLHHIVKIDDDPSLALDADNLQTVCARCHLKIHRERMEERDGM